MNWLRLSGLVRIPGKRIQILLPANSVAGIGPIHPSGYICQKREYFKKSFTLLCQLPSLGRLI